MSDRPSTIRCSQSGQAVVQSKPGALSLIALPARALRVRVRVVPAERERDNMIKLRRSLCLRPHQDLRSCAAANPASPPIALEHTQLVYSLDFSAEAQRTAYVRLAGGPEVMRAPSARHAAHRASAVPIAWREGLPAYLARPRRSIARGFLLRAIVCFRATAPRAEPRIRLMGHEHGTALFACSWVPRPTRPSLQPKLLGAA